MKPLGLAVAASLLTIVALGPCGIDARAASGGRAPNGVDAARSDSNGHGVAVLAQNDQMYMQQESSGDNVDTGDQSPPDDQSVDTDTGDAAEPQAAEPQDNNPGTADPDAAQPGYDGADAGGDSGSNASGADQSDSDSSANLMNNEGGFSASQDQPPGEQP